MNARNEVLARIRAGIADALPPMPVERTYRRAGEYAPGALQLLDLFEDRLKDYGAKVRRSPSERLPEAIRTVLAALLPERAAVVVPRGLPRQWVELGAVDDDDLGPTVLDTFAAVVTACAGAAAETGTIALDGSPGQGRRVLTLIPDMHLCVVYASQVCGTVPELLFGLEPTRPLTLISGPSATSDIELHRVEGVHGPRRLVVLIATD